MMILDFVQNTEDIVDEALKETRLTEDDTNVVLAVGGSTRIPCVRNLLKRKFGAKVKIDINPDEVVALGAAVQAGIKSGQFDSESEIIITDVCQYSLGISVATDTGNGWLMSGVFDVLIPKDTTIPVTYEKDYFTLQDNHAVKQAVVIRDDIIDNNKKLIQNIEDEKLQIVDKLNKVIEEYNELKNSQKDNADKQAESSKVIKLAIQETWVS